jgi:hypothetical protein
MRPSVVVLPGRFAWSSDRHGWRNRANDFEETVCHSICPAVHDLCLFDRRRSVSVLSRVRTRCRPSAWVAFLTAGIFIGIGGALLAGSAVFVIPGLFTAIGLAAILFALDNTDEQGAVLFGLIFGGSFLIGGLAVPVVGGIRWLRTQRAP